MTQTISYQDGVKNTQSYPLAISLKTLKINLGARKANQYSLITQLIVGYLLNMKKEYGTIAA